jgi:hypothetical protein
MRPIGAAILKIEGANIEEKPNTPIHYVFVLLLCMLKKGRRDEGREKGTKGRGKKAAG